MMHEGRTMFDRKTDLVLGQPIEVGNKESVTRYIFDEVELWRPALICFSTAHMLVMTRTDAAVHAAYASATMILPDGVPIAWCLRTLGHHDAECISGPRLMPVLLREAERRGVSVGFYGSRQETLDRMITSLARDLPALKVSYVCSPPFRSLSDEEQRGFLDDIDASGTQMLFVGLGSPKQELWMHEHARDLKSVSLGVGAAFEFLSGERFLPPLWIQRLGLTWLIRLCQEPRRLFVRNLYSPIFVFLFLKQRLLGSRLDQASVPENFGD